MKVICAVFCLVARLRAPGSMAIKEAAEVSLIMKCVVSRDGEVDVRVQMTPEKKRIWSES
jgi:hypothetical protein